MIVGIAVQALAITAATLGAFLIGLRIFPDQLHAAQTMAFATLSISELFRAYTARSEHYSVFQIGVFTNRYMQYAVLSSLAILLSIVYVPFLDPVFDTAFLGPAQWAEILPLILLPSIAAEITKWFLRRSDARRLAGMGEPSK
jgi:P-type Ca2+ transporter type 2C